MNGRVQAFAGGCLFAKAAIAEHECRKAGDGSAGADPIDAAKCT